MSPFQRWESQDLERGKQPAKVTGKVPGSNYQSVPGWHIILEQYVDWASLGYLRGGSLLPHTASPWPVLLFYPLSCWQIPSVSSQAAPRVVRHINDGRPWPLFLPISSQSPFPRAHTGLGLPSYLIPSPGGIMAHSESVQP